MVVWVGSGSPATIWHDENSSSPPVTFDRYDWCTPTCVTILNPSNILLPDIGAAFSHNFSYVVDPNTSGDFAVTFTDNINAPPFRHGRDFVIQIGYLVGNLQCSVQVQGRYGPVIQPTVPAVVSGPFSISAIVTDPDVSTTDGVNINHVVFEVYDSNLNLVFAHTETTAPYCFNSDIDSVCNPIDPYGYWPGTGTLIANGDYTVLIRAQDDDPHRQSTQVRRPFTIDTANGPGPSVPNITDNAPSLRSESG